MKSYKPQELFDENGKLVPELAALAPKKTRRMSDNPHANGGLLLRDLRLPDFRKYAVKVSKPGTEAAEATRVMGKFLRDVMKLNADGKNFRVFGPDETDVEPARRGAGSDQPHMAGGYSAGRRPPLAGRPRDGNPERAHLPGLAGGLPADRPARILLLLRGVHPHHRLDVQPARQVAQDHARQSRGGGRSRR